MSVATAIWTIKKKNEEIFRRKEISEYAKMQIRKELRGLMAPLLFDAPDSVEVPAIDFGYVKDTLHLRMVFAQSIFGSPSSQNRNATNFVRDSLAIQNNQHLLNQTIAKYSGYLDGEILRSVDEIFSDDFYNSYSLKGFGTAFDIALSLKTKYPKIDEKKLNQMTSFGNYYATDPIVSKSNPFEGLSGLIAKFEKLYNEASE